MRVVIRADASSAIGSGHVMRCLSLAEELRRGGGMVLFVCADLPGAIGQIVEARGFDLVTLPVDADDVGGTIAAIGADGADWLIVDHYGRDRSYESALRAAARRILVIDDLADRPHDCDILLDATEAPDAAPRYLGLVPPDALVLTGLNWALLRDEFRRLRQGLRRRHGPVGRLLVSFGANDPIGMTLRIAPIISKQKYAGIRVDLFGGVSNPREAEVARTVAGADHVSYAVYSDQMPELMATADLAIGAGGTTAWERCALGLPALVIALAENQLGVGACVARLGAARFLGSGQWLTDAELEEAIDAALADHAWRSAASDAGMRAVDGLGARRTAEILLGGRV